MQILVSHKRIYFIITLIFFTVQTLQSQTPDIGMELYTFRDQFAKDVPGTLAMIHKMGFTEIEGGGSYNLKDAEYKKLLDKNGLKMIGWGADFDSLAINPGPIAEKAKFYGAKFVVCFWIPHTGNNFNLDNAKKAVEVFNRAGAFLKEKGLSLCYHAHGFEFGPYEHGTLFDYMMAHIDHRFANFEMDVYWVKHPGQDPVALLKKYPGRFPLMHLKDRKPGTPGNMNGTADVESNVVLGTGDVGIAAIMKESKKAGVKHYFIEDESSHSVQQVPLSMQYLRKLK